MQKVDIETLIASHLEDVADQVAQLHAQGEPELAEILREEGLTMASAFDNGDSFFYVNDLRIV